MARTKLTEEMVGQAIRLKADGLSNGDIICALGIHESTFYRLIGNPRGRLQRALCEGLKKEEASFKQTLLTTIRAAALARNQDIIVHRAQPPRPGPLHYLDTIPNCARSPNSSPNPYRPRRTVTKRWFLLLGLSGMVILSTPSRTRGIR